jgi:hypothetical protein
MVLHSAEEKHLPETLAEYTIQIKETKITGPFNYSK